MICTLGIQLFAQTDDTKKSKLKIGADVDYLLNYHNISDFQGFSLGVPNCSDNLASVPQTQGFSAGLSAEYMFNKEYGVHLRVGFSDYSASLSQLNQFIGYQQNSQNKLVEMYANHYLDTKLQVLSLSPTFIAKPFSFPIALTVGIEAGFFITKTFSQREELTEASAANGFNYKSEQAPVRNNITGTIDNASPVFLSVIPSVRYDFPFSKSLTVSPSIGYGFGLTKMIQGVNWSLANMRVGISAMYELPSGLPPCSSGFVRDAAGNCVQIPCPPGKFRDAEGNCVFLPCAEGMYRNDAGDCVPKEIRCEKGYVWDKVTGDCVPENITKPTKCAYLEFCSLEDKISAETVLQILIKNGLNEPKIEEWTDVKLDNKIRYRVRAGCYKDALEAANARMTMTSVVQKIKDAVQQSYDVPKIKND